ncbi:uncharacterized protein EAF01_007959 [Botrytis porri]|uniref:uncharacterized protein n=1 Tax=Botrytis porri TaxID=87229 RepID=UPI001900C815|nr:uncharacterized protein EAF01_007959 [Botrytis porri]KAF7900657.1 hypothetical protein EAF01_007959 [Botrytis porri]
MSLQSYKCNYEDCSIHNPHSTEHPHSPSSPLKVKSPSLPPSEDLDDISTLELDSPPPYLSDCDTLSTEEEGVDSEEEQSEAMAEYHESRDTLMSFAGGSGRSGLH